MENVNWRKKASVLIKTELKKKDVSYIELSERLVAIGVTDNANNVNGKINRGAFGFDFFLQCMHVIGTNTVRLED